MSRTRKWVLDSIRLGLAVALLSVNWSSRAHADTVVAAVVGKVGNNVNNVNGGRMKGGTFFAIALSQDSNAIPKSDNDTKSGKYLTSTSPVTTRAVSRAAADGCVKWSPSATTTINWANNSWDAKGSTAAIAALGNGMVAEWAEASCIVIDPDDWVVHFAPGTPDPRVELSITFSGTSDPCEMIAKNGSGLPEDASEAQVDGNSVCSLLSGPLFEYNWHATSSNPAATTFSFTSNPSLGMNDLAVMSLFLSKVGNPEPGRFVLSEDVTIVASIPVVPDANGDVAFTFGGETEYKTIVNPAAYALGVSPLPGAHFALHGLRPNPSRGTDLAAAFSVPTAGPVMLRLYDLRGRAVSSRQIEAVAGENVVNLSNAGLPPAIYWLELDQAGRSVSTKVCVYR